MKRLLRGYFILGEIIEDIVDLVGFLIVTIFIGGFIGIILLYLTNLFLHLLDIPDNGFLYFALCALGFLSLLYYLGGKNIDEEIERVMVLRMPEVITIEEIKDMGASDALIEKYRNCIAMKEESQ